MTRVAIVPVPTNEGGLAYHAVAGDKQSYGGTAGEALDALTPQLSEDERATIVIVQSFRPDRFFGAEKQGRMVELMEQWREAQDAGTSLPDSMQAELDALIEEEIRASARRTAALLDEMDQ
jgi:hypothetical protein